MLAIYILSLLDSISSYPITSTDGVARRSVVDDLNDLVNLINPVLSQGTRVGNVNAVSQASQANQASQSGRGQPGQSQAGQASRTGRGQLGQIQSSARAGNIQPVRIIPISSLLGSIGAVPLVQPLAETINFGRLPLSISQVSQSNTNDGDSDDSNSTVQAQSSNNANAAAQSKATTDNNNTPDGIAVLPIKAGDVSGIVIIPMPKGSLTTQQPTINTNSQVTSPDSATTTPNNFNGPTGQHTINKTPQGSGRLDPGVSDTIAATAVNPVVVDSQGSAAGSGGGTAGTGTNSAAAAVSTAPASLAGTPQSNTNAVTGGVPSSSSMSVGDSTDPAASGTTTGLAGARFSDAV